MTSKPVFFSLLLSFTADILFLKTSFEGLAVVLFIAVQYCHRSLLSVSEKHFASFSLTGICGTGFLLTLASFLHIKSSLLLAAAFFYISLFVFNLIYAWIVHVDSTPLLLRLCLAMLFICDIHVGLFNLPRFVTLSDSFLLFYCTHIASRVLWLFYLPGQLILLYLFFCLIQQKPPAVLL